jgi:hypothetical protein
MRSKEMQRLPSNPSQLHPQPWMKHRNQPTEPNPKIMSRKFKSILTLNPGPDHIVFKQRPAIFAGPSAAAYANALKKRAEASQQSQPSPPAAVDEATNGEASNKAPKIEADPNAEQQAGETGKGSE